MMLQLPGLEAVERKSTSPEPTPPALDEIALVYTASMNGVGVPRYFMSIEDAQTFCSDPRTCGEMYGSPWAFFWTSVANLLSNSPAVNYSRRQLFDDGRYDYVLHELGITPLDMTDRRIPTGLIRYDDPSTAKQFSVKPATPEDSDRYRRNMPDIEEEATA